MKNQHGKLAFTLSLLLGVTFIYSSLNIIFTTGFKECPLSLIFAICIGSLGLLNSFILFKDNNYKLPF